MYCSIAKAPQPYIMVLLSALIVVKTTTNTYYASFQILTLVII